MIFRYPGHSPSLYFNSNTVEGAYESEEFAFDPTVVKEILLENNKEFKNLTYFFDEQLTTVQQDKPYFKLDFISGLRIKSQGVFNCTYASVNQILDLFGFDLFDIKYEICALVDQYVGFLNNLLLKMKLKI